MNSLGRYSGYAYAVMRIIVGLLFAAHGAQKLLGWFPNPGRPAGPLDTTSMIAGGIELVGGILIALGLFTRPAAFLASGLMAAAYFMAHAKGSFFPIVNRGELAVVYCFLFLYMFFRGAGPFSLDNMIFKTRTDEDDIVAGHRR